MNNLAKKLITLVVIATVAFYAFTSFKNTQSLKRLHQCQGKLEFCFGGCKTYETCEELQKKNDAVVIQANCQPPMHPCGGAYPGCFSGWCPGSSGDDGN